MGGIGGGEEVEVVALALDDEWVGEVGGRESPERIGESAAAGVSACWSVATGFEKEFSVAAEFWVVCGVAAELAA